MKLEKLKNIIEGGLFAAGRPMKLADLQKLFPELEQPKVEDLEAALESLREDYKQRGVELNKVASGYRFQVRRDYTPWVSRLWEEKPPRYSRALMETLALIAYRQPITRAEIEEIRGVSVATNIIKTLQERDWVKVVGHKDVPGKPALFATTADFLDYFNLSSLEQLPPLADLSPLDLDAAANEDTQLSDVGDQQDVDVAAVALADDEEAALEAHMAESREEIAALSEEADLAIKKADSVDAAFEQMLEQDFKPRDPAVNNQTGEDELATQEIEGDIAQDDTAELQTVDESSDTVSEATAVASSSQEPEALEQEESETASGQDSQLSDEDASLSPDSSEEATATEMPATAGEQFAEDATLQDVEDEQNQSAQHQKAETQAESPT